MAEKQNYVDESGVSRIFNTMYNGSQQLLLTAKMKILGEGYWIPSDDKEIVEVPHHALKVLIRLRENDIFSICRSDYSAGAQYHVIMKWKHSERISIVRAKSMTDIIHEFNGFVVFKELYGFTAKRKCYENA
uniref:Uncharacterized protein n=1 Tax=Romanomermis culicivorax TaxID=13658 RepID=A0A915II12_ROMCU